VLLVALGSLVGGSAGGVVLTVLGCALLGGWLRWAHEAGQERLAARGARRVARRDRLVFPSARYARGNNCDKELVLWN
jgi:hypothetical protein